MEQLCKIRDLYRAITNFETEFQKQFNISLNEGMALCTLKNMGQLSSGQLSELLGLTASNTSKVIKTLESKGLLKRGIGKDDKRIMLFSLNDKGKKSILDIMNSPLVLPAILAETIEKTG